MGLRGTKKGCKGVLCYVLTRIIYEDGTPTKHFPAFLKHMGDYKIRVFSEDDRCVRYCGTVSSDCDQCKKDCETCEANCYVNDHGEHIYKPPWYNVFGFLGWCIGMGRKYFPIL